MSICHLYHFFGEVFVQMFCLCFLLGCLSSYWIVSTIYIKRIHVLCQLYVLQIFSFQLGLHFNFQSCLLKNKSFKLDEVQFIDFFFLSQFMIFYVLFKKSLLNPRSLRFFLMLLFRNVIYLTFFHVWKQIVCLEGIIWPLWGWYSIHGWL